MESAYLNIDYTLAVWLLLSAAFVCGMILLSVYRSRIVSLSRKVAADDEEPMPVDGYPPVSVVVYAQAAGMSLRKLLLDIIKQDYPAPMEVIVVNDDCSPFVADLVNELEMRYPNVYMTYAPRNSRNLSRRKLCITLGLKAARYDAIMLTTANCRILSPIWLRLMMRHMAAGKKVVLGWSLAATYPGADASADPMADFDATGESDVVPEVARLSRMATFDVQWSAVRWLGQAICGRPFMGDGCNLAYSRKLFFDNKGFSRTLELNYGDDDIFVSEVADPQNTAVELSPDSVVLSQEVDPMASHKVEKIRRSFTSDYLPRRPYLFMGLFSVFAWAFFVALIFASVLAAPSVVAAVVSLILAAAVWVPLMVAWRNAARALGLRRRAMLLLPLYVLRHPFYGMRFRLKRRDAARDNFTWGL